VCPTQQEGEVDAIHHGVDVIMENLFFAKN
jgi:hypothetical protein